jgi:hypothetical protein
VYLAIGYVVHRLIRIFLSELTTAPCPHCIGSARVGQQSIVWPHQGKQNQAEWFGVGFRITAPRSLEIQRLWLKKDFDIIVALKGLA